MAEPPKLAAEMLAAAVATRWNFCKACPAWDEARSLCVDFEIHNKNHELKYSQDRILVTSASEM